MIKKITAIIVFIVVLICFCRTCRLEAGCNCSTPKLSTIDGMIQYLAPLPAVWTVESWQSKYGDGLIISTQHYRIYTTLLEPLMLKQMPAFVEVAYRGYQSQISSPAEMKERFNIYLFKSRQQWEEFTKEFTGDQWPVYKKIKKGAYFLNGLCVTYNIGRKRTFSVIGHEGWHQFCNGQFKYRLPSWLDEGIAQLFETSEYNKGKFVFKPSRNYGRLAALKITLRNKQMIPLSKLISLNPGEVVMWNNSDKAVMAFYAQSYALVRFLREDGYGKRLGKYHQMLLGAFNGSWPLSDAESKIASDRSIALTARWNSYIARKLFDIYIGESIQQIEPEYLRFCKKIVYRLRLK